VSRVGLGFRLTQNLGVLKESKVRASFHFWVWILTVALRSCSSWCPCVEYFCEEVWGRRVGLGFCLTGFCLEK
jgi:hypothetical protein